MKAKEAKEFYHIACSSHMCGEHEPDGCSAEKIERGKLRAGLKKLAKDADVKLGTMALSEHYGDLMLFDDEDDVSVSLAVSFLQEERDAAFAELGLKPLKRP
jgi:hypothetical protein